MPKTTVSNYLLGGSGKGRHPATMGSELSVNMFMETSDKVSYLASVPGLQFYRKIWMGRCRGSYVSSVGLNNTKEDAFVVWGNNLFRIDAQGNYERLGYVNAGTRRVSFAETGGLRPFLLVADGENLWCYDLLVKYLQP